jgi:methylenetetrahydrofolate reductase (NADPH)
LPASNPLKDAHQSGKFCYMVELVASAKTPAEKLFEISGELAQIPGVVAAGITSFAGGSAGLDPIFVGAGVQARGLSPNVHITCVNRTRQNAQEALLQMHQQGMENVFAITGDYPLGAEKDAGPSLYDLDSVQLVEMVSEFRTKGIPFYTSVAVSPFKYSEADCAYQYLKLEKKVAAGADFAISQLGYDSKKCRELKRYVDERGLKIPLMGNVYVLSGGAAKKFAKAEPPGCWVSPELLARVTEEAKAEDKGVAARLEFAARMVAMLRGLGYAGAYFGGEHSAARIRGIIERSEELAPRAEEFIEEISYGRKDGFYFYESPRAKTSLSFPLKVVDTMAAMFPVKRDHDSAIRGALSGVFGWVDKHPGLAHKLDRLEVTFKQPAFGCKDCGNCVLGEMEYVCPMTCPKNLRNGPCGGTNHGQCEVIPEQKCIWVAVYDNAKAANRVDGLKTYIPPRDRALQGTSSWINLFLDRGNRPGQEPPLVTIDLTAPLPAPKEPEPAKP